MLQGKSEGIDHAMARPARLGLGLNRHALSRRQIGMKVGGQGSDGFRRRSQHPAEHAAGNENPAMNRRARGRIGKARHQVGVSKQPGTPLLLERNLLERCVRWEFGSIKRRQPTIQVNVVRPQELAISPMPPSR